MSDGDRLLLSSVPGQGASELLDLSDGALVPCAETLHCQRQENYSLVIAWLPGLVHLALMATVRAWPGSEAAGATRLVPSLDCLPRYYIGGEAGSGDAAEEGKEKLLPSPPPGVLLAWS